jgi:hypothetical protein
MSGDKDLAIAAKIRDGELGSGIRNLQFPPNP